MRIDKITPAVGHANRASVLAGSKAGRTLLLAIALSYVVDGVLLAGFASVGTVSFEIPIAYTLVGFAECGMVLWFTKADGDSALFRTLFSSAFQLTFATLAPNVSFYFFTSMFTVFGFGSLGLSVRQAVTAWVALVMSALVVAALTHIQISIPHATATERWLVSICFFVTLGRCVVLGLFGRMMRIRLQDRREQLRESMAALQERDKALVRINKDLQFQATHDQLTGMANRVLFVERLDQAISDGRPFVLCALDLDRFKVINDSLGHAAGDALLQHVARRLNSFTRQSDFAARASGDEFLLLSRDIESPKEAEAFVQRCASALAQPHHVATMELHVSPSIGVAHFPRDGTNADDLLSRADEAMYCAKRSGRNAVRFFDPRVMGYSRERLDIEADLRRAVASGQLQLHYQPKIDISSGEIRAVEALLRWQHPTRGSIPPADFIPIAEETGLIVEIGAWVIGEACRQAREWQLQGLPFIRIAVNVSPLQFNQSGFISMVKQALADNCLQAAYLEFEMTEATLMADAEASVTLLKELSALGVLLAVDDFGTGYSSMSYLQRFPIDKLKIDRSFISNVASNPEDAAIVRAIISLAHGLRLKVIAEGVESAPQLEVLKSLGCDQYQGFYRSPAVAAVQIERLVAQTARPMSAEPNADYTQSKLRRAAPT